jgi:hypothetical protein
LTSHEGIAASLEVIGISWEACLKLLRHLRLLLGKLLGDCRLWGWIVSIKWFKLLHVILLLNQVCTRASDQGSIKVKEGIWSLALWRLDGRVVKWEKVL